MRPVSAPKGCWAWMRPNSHSWHRYPHRLGPSCREFLTRKERVEIAILTGRAMGAQR